MKGFLMKASVFVDLITSAIPYTSTAGVLIKEWIEKQIKEKQEIILLEIREGTFNNIDTDDAIGIAHRLWRAISEGTAKNNFRLLCRLVQGLGEKKQLNAPTFLRFSSILDSLTEEEIDTIASDIWFYKNPKPVVMSYISYSSEQQRIEKEQLLAQQKENLKQWEEKRDMFLSTLKHCHGSEDEELHYALLRTGLYTLDVIPEAYISHREAEYKGPEESWELVDAGSRRDFKFTSNMNDLMSYVDFYIKHK